MKILVSDDDVQLNRALSRYLERSGYEVHSASDGLQAWDILGRVEGFGLVIAELRLPLVGGLDLLAMIRAEARLAQIPVILVCADPEDGMAEQALRKGAAFFLPKPLDFERLLTLVKFAE